MSDSPKQPEVGAAPEPGPEAPGDTRPRKSGAWKKIALLVLFLAAAVLLYVKFGDALNLESLAAQEAGLREFRAEHPFAVYGLAFLIYVAVTGFSLPGAAILTLVYGWFFGFWHGTLMVSFASTAGATIAFLFSRFLLRDSIQNRFGERLQNFDTALRKEGAFYLFTLRLIPVVPFFVINLVMGLTPLKARTFWWVSQLGMLPGTMAYVYAGSSVPDFATLAEQGAKGIVSPQLLLAFVILGLLPIVLKKVVNRVKAARSREPQPSSAS